MVPCRREPMSLPKVSINRKIDYKFASPFRESWFCLIHFLISSATAYSVKNTSAAGNTYYRAIRLSKRLAVYYHIGEGYAHTFLNGIALFCWDGQKAKIIAQKFWGDCNWRCFSEQFAKEQSIIMLKDFLTGQVKALGSHVSEQQMLSFSREMIEETKRKQLPR